MVFYTSGIPLYRPGCVCVWPAYIAAELPVCPEVCAGDGGDCGYVTGSVGS